MQSRLQVSDLERMLELGLKTTAKAVVEKLLSAIRDWPCQVVYLDDYFKQVQEELDVEKLDYGAVRKFLDRLPSKDSLWKAESMSILSGVFHLISEDDLVDGFEEWLRLNS